MRRYCRSLLSSDHEVMASRRSIVKYFLSDVHSRDIRGEQPSGRPSCYKGYTTECLPAWSYRVDLVWTLSGETAVRYRLPADCILGGLYHVPTSRDRTPHREKMTSAINLSAVGVGSDNDFSFGGSSNLQDASAEHVDANIVTRRALGPACNLQSGGQGSIFGQDAALGSTTGEIPCGIGSRIDMMRLSAVLNTDDGNRVAMRTSDAERHTSDQPQLLIRAGGAGILRSALASQRFRVMLERVPIPVEGRGLLEALSTRMAVAPIYAMAFDRRVLDELDVTVNRQGGTGGGWAPATLRRRGGGRKYVRVGGVLSLWVHSDGRSVVVYARGEDVKELVAHHWHLSRRAEQKLVHALVGNGSYPEWQQELCDKFSSIYLTGEELAETFLSQNIYKLDPFSRPNFVGPLLSNDVRMELNTFEVSEALLNSTDLLNHAHDFTPEEPVVAIGLDCYTRAAHPRVLFFTTKMCYIAVVINSTITYVWATPITHLQRIVHILMGNQDLNGLGKNRFSVLTGYSAEEAIARGEAIEDVRACLSDSVAGSESSYDDSCSISDAEQHTSDPPELGLSTQLPDKECEDLLRPYMSTFVKALRMVAKEPSVKLARRWSTAHALSDCAGPRDKPLDYGPRVQCWQPLKNQAEQKGKKGKGKGEGKSKSQKVRDAQRMRQWLEDADPDIADAWVRARRPDPAQVPANSDYMASYGRRRLRSEVYPQGVEEPDLFLAFAYVEDVAAEKAAYMGPLTRGLIQRLLMIGNIEMLPGPCAAAALNNYGYDGSLHGVTATAVNMLCSAFVDIVSIVNTRLPSDWGCLHPGCQIGPGIGATAATLCVGYDDGVSDYIAVVNCLDGDGSAFGCDYQHVVVTGLWDLVFTDAGGLVHGVEDPIRLMRNNTVVASCHWRNADGVVAGSIHLLLRTAGAPPHQRVRDPRMRFAGMGSSVHMFRGCNNTIFELEGDSNMRVAVDTNLVAECERLFGASVSRYVATSNVVAVLRSASKFDGRYIGMVAFALSEMMLPTAMVVTAVGSDYRDAAIARAKKGKGMPGLLSRVFWQVPEPPDYGAMTHNETPPWEAVWALRGAGVLVAAIIGYCAYCKVHAGIAHIVEAAPIAVRGVVDKSVDLAREVMHNYNVARQPIQTEFNWDSYIANSPSAGKMPSRWPNLWAASPSYVSLPTVEIDPWARTAVDSLPLVTRGLPSGTELPPQWSSALLNRIPVSCGLWLAENSISLKDYLDGVPDIRVKGNSLEVLWMYVGIVAPLLEESAKRVWWPARYLIPLVEVATDYSLGLSVTASTLLRCSLHFGFGALPFWLGVGAHSGFNMANMMSGVLAGRRFVVASLPIEAQAVLAGCAILQKGVTYWKSRPMGLESALDALMLEGGGPPLDKLMKLSIAPKRPRYGKVSKAEVFQIFPSILPMASFANNRGNFVHSAAGRVGRPTPEALDLVGVAQIESFLHELAWMVKSCKGPVVPDDFAEFVAKFPPAKRKAYVEANDLFDLVGTRPIFNKKYYKDFKADECACFLKHELNVERPDVFEIFNGQVFLKAAADPRTICPRWLPLQAKMIPYILAMERNVKEVLEKHSGKLFGVNVRFASGLAPEEMSAICHTLMAETGLDCIIVNGDDGMFTNLGIAYYVDGTRWDAHFRAEYHHIIIEAYRIMGLPRHLVEAMHHLVFRKLKWGMGISARINRNNASGESDTTFRNGLQNFATQLIALRRAGELNSSFLERAKALGFVYEVEAKQTIVADPYGDFCARVWIVGETGPRLILKFGRVWAKVSWTVCPTIPFVELRAAKWDAAMRELQMFPEVIAEMRVLADKLPVVTARAGAWVRLQSYNYGLSDAAFTTTLEVRKRFFALRYGIDYFDVVDGVRDFVNAELAGLPVVYNHALRVVAERDMGVSSLHSVVEATGRKLVPLGCEYQQGSAVHSRLGFIEEKGRAKWLADIWGWVMHCLNGNGKASPSAKSWVGGRREFYLVKLIFSRADTWLSTSSKRMNNQKNRSNAKQAKKAIAAVERLVTKSGKAGQGQKKRNRKQSQAAQSLQVQRQKKVAVPRTVGGYNALTERWRRALLDPFAPDSVGVVAAGDFFVRNAVPYTIKRNIQLTSVGSSGTVLVHPSLNCMAWNPDTNITLGGNGSYKLYCSNTASPVTGPVGNPRPFTPSQLSGTAVGLSLPQMNGLFSKYRIVACGVRFRFNGTVTNSSGKCISVAVPYDGYLPVGTYNTTNPGVAIDTPYTSGSNYADDYDAYIYSCHPDSNLTHRRHVASALVNDMNLPVSFQGTNAPTIPSGTVLGLPHSETFMINETVGKVFEMQPRPSSCELWKWRDTGMSGTGSNAGTTTEQIYLNAGTDSFPAAINVYYVTGASAAAINMVDTDCDTSSVRAMGFESCALCFDGLTAGQQFGDLELIYHIEAVPNTQAGTVVPGCNPAGAMVERRPRQVASRAASDDMLMAVSAIPNQMMLTAAQALSGVARAAALGPTAGAGRLLANMATQAFM